MKRAAFLAVFALAGCTAAPVVSDKLAETAKPVTIADAGRGMTVTRLPASIGNALLPPLTVERPMLSPAPAEPIFDLFANEAPARQVFLSIVSGSSYSIVIHPEVSGLVSVDLKGVTVQESLEVMRKTYGYAFRTEGARIYVEPAPEQRSSGPVPGVGK